MLPALAMRDGYISAMAVHLTRIYTRTGDDGTTGLADFTRVSKTDPRLVAYADCDETNAALGLVMALGAPAPDVAAVVARVQNELFDLGADLATPIADPPHPPLRVTQDYIDRLEADCDRFNENLAPLTSFILPGGSPGRGPAAPGEDRCPARRTQRLGAAGGRSGSEQTVDRHVPEPTVRPAVHSAPGWRTRPAT